MSHQQRHKELSKLIDGYNKQYHLFDNSPVPDSIYDQLFRELKDIEKAHPELVTPASPTQRVGFMAANHFTKFAHPFPMLSLSNSFTASELIDWIQTIPMQIPTFREKEDIIGELKLDGASLELIYVDGKLNRAVTRGDGHIGEDVTLNALTIDGIPNELKKFPDGEVVIRGEVIVKKTVFERINSKLAADGKKTYVNQRNYASGALRQKDPEVTRERELTFISYSTHFMIDDAEKNPDVATIENARWWRHNNGFYNSPIQNFHVNSTLEEIESFLKSQEDIRDRGLWEYDIDGLVFKVNSVRAQIEMGYTSHEPKWATAYKFPASEGVTILNGITVQVGRTGQLTPVAEVEPVFIHGTTISRVTLHNFDEIKRLGITIGDHVVIKRAGDVIPKLIQVIDPQPVERQYKYDEKCPCCGSLARTVVTKVKNKPDATTYYCPNMGCKDRVINHLAYCAGRSVYNIMDLGTETITNLFEKCGYNSMRDHIRLFSLTKAELIHTGLSEYQAEKLLVNIEKARKITLDRLLTSFGIDGVAEGTADRLAAQFGTLDAIANASVEDLMKVEKVGEIIAECIFQFFDTFKAEGWYNRYIVMLNVVNPAPRSELLKGKSIMITGSKFGNMDRKGITAYYKTLSASVTSSVNSNTHICLFGTNYTAHKLETAKELGVPYKIFDTTGVIEDTTCIEGYRVTKF